ncbi:alcohol acetyltransferase [Brachybacterium alimentarium]|uniref:alcohol acetyltransferase n=1 Tax=Brachybacterium alimentarium TaxID=47845 RepID=UPI003FD6351A
MMRQHWVRLDNASNMFLAARSDVDPKVFRLGAEMDHEVDPALLHEALEKTYEKYPLYHAVLRRGVFWYYLQDSDLRPEVTAELTAPCAPIYQADRRTLLFRVMHHRRRISLEVFHALSDGTGALWFLTDLVTAYVRLRFPTGRPTDPGADDATEAAGGSGAAEASAGTGAMPGEDLDDPAAHEPVHDLTGDSFAHYFRRRRRPGSDAWQARAAFTQEAEAEDRVLGVGPRGADADPGPRDVTGSRDGTGDVAGADGSTEDSADAPRRVSVGRRRLSLRRRVYRVRGTRTPDHRTRVVELTMPAAAVIALARAEGVALTMYLTAVFFEAVRRAAEHDALTLAATVPVNLRQFFPSTSARNFFATTRVEHAYRSGPNDLGAVARTLERDFRAKATAEALEGKLRRFLRFERHPALRIMPRPVKDVLLSGINRASNRGLSVAVSNLGRVVLPEPVSDHVGRLAFEVSAVRPQFCAISHAGRLTVTFTSPFVETDHVREFARILTGAGVEISVAAGRVTGQELAEAFEDHEGDGGLEGDGGPEGDEPQEDAS